jgi:hypothetical protein
MKIGKVQKRSKERRIIYRKGDPKNERKNKYIVERIEQNNNTIKGIN